MNFDKLHGRIPYATGKVNHVVEMTPYEGITLAMPGRHQDDTSPIGGDFVVMVDDESMGWKRHQFTHDDLFLDTELKYVEDPPMAELLMLDYAKVVFGDDPEEFDADFEEIPPGWKTSVCPRKFLRTVQCLAVAEHRRYHQFEKNGGGRFLPARFASGIVEGRWTAADCKAHQRRGRQGLENLMKEKGRPTTLRKLLAA